MEQVTRRAACSLFFYLVYHHMFPVYVPFAVKTEAGLFIHGDGGGIFPDDAQIDPGASVFLLQAVQEAGEGGASIPLSLEGFINEKAVQPQAPKGEVWPPEEAVHGKTYHDVAVIYPNGPPVPVMCGLRQAFLYRLHIAFLFWGNAQLKRGFPVLVCYWLKMQIHIVITYSFMRFIITEAGMEIKP